jgi:hypothetical protein
MLNKITRNILVIILGASTVIYILFVFAEIPNKTNNGFNRKWLNKDLLPIIEKEFSLPSNRICGISKNSIYVTADNPQHILVFNRKLELIDTLFLNMNIAPNKVVPNFLEIDSPRIFLHLNNLETVYYGNISTRSMNFTKLNTGIFLRSAQLSPSTMIIRSFVNSLTNLSFTKIDVITGKKMLTKNFIGNDTDDGLANDGMLLYDKDLNKLLYVKYFKNQFYSADTNFNLLYKANTIDTTFTGNAKTGIEWHGKEAKIIPSIARIEINKYAFAGDSLLYIQSGLRADNEGLNSFVKKDDIDIYKLSNGKYIGSLALRKQDNESFKSAKVINDTLLVLYTRKIAMYKLPK